MRPRLIITVLLAAAVALAAAWLLVHAPVNAPDNAADNEPLSATVLPEPLPLPEFSLRDHNGDPFTRDSLRGRTNLLFFGFTHCPDICPATLQQLSLARKQLAAGGNDVALPGIVLISVDPERDTPSILKPYVAHFGDGVSAATGSMDEIVTLTSALGIYFEKDEREGGDYTIGHSTAVLVVDENAAFKALFSAPHDVESFAHDIPLLAASK